MIHLVYGTVIVVLVLLLLFFKKEAKAIAQQVESNNQQNGHTSKSRLTVSLFDADLNRLCAAINTDIDRYNDEKSELIKINLENKTLIANVSHDIRTPLTSMIGYLQLLTREELSTSQSEYLAICLEKGAELKKLLDDFFELSLIHSDTEELGLQKINLSRFFEEKILSHYEEFERAHISPELETQKKQISIYFNQHSLERIADNLISNAIKYGSDYFKIAVSEQAGFIHLDFSNRIPKNSRLDESQVFNRFYTGDESRAKGEKGTGIGLSIVKAFVEKSDGSISAMVKNDAFKIQITLPNE